MDKFFAPENGIWTIEKLLEAKQKPINLKWIPFGGHKAPLYNSPGPHLLSQWWPHTFRVEDVCYKTAEYFMTDKSARLFKDDKMLEKF